MIKRLTVVILAVCASWLMLTASQAVHTWFDRSNAIEVAMNLGNKAGDLVITPSQLELNRGELYKLVIHNPSGVEHILVAPEFGKAVLTPEVKWVGWDDEISNDYLLRSAETFPYEVRELRIMPGGSVEWYFMPMVAGNYKMGCNTLEHAVAGMHALFLVN